MTGKGQIGRGPRLIEKPSCEGKVNGRQNGRRQVVPLHTKCFCLDVALQALVPAFDVKTLMAERG